MVVLGENASYKQIWCLKMLNVLSFEDFKLHWKIEEFHRKTGYIHFGQF